MPVSHLRYKLANGYMVNWLVAGPQSIPVPNDFHSLSADKISRSLYSSDSGISQLPVERGPLDDGIFQIDNFQGSWKYYQCDEDRFIDFSGENLHQSYQRAWAYAQLKTKSERIVTLTLTVFGPVDIWINEVHVQRWEDFSSSWVLLLFSGTRGKREDITILFC